MKLSIFSMIMVPVFLIVLSIQSFSQSTESLMSAGQELLQRGAFSQSVTSFRQVLSREPGNFEAQFNLALAYLQWGRQENAVDEFKKALSLQPKSSLAWANLAIAYENLGKKQDAVNSLYKAVELDPENTTARMNLAAMYANAGDQKNAISQFKQVVKLDPRNEEALTNLASSLIDVGQLTEARTYLRQVIEINPSNATAHWELGNILWKSDNDTQKALGEYRTAVTIQPDNVELYDNYAGLLEEQGKKAEALEVLKKSLTYITDALKKDKVQEKIDKLEGRTAPGTRIENHDSTKSSQSQLDSLKKELRPSEQKGAVKMMKTGPMNVLDDIKSVTGDDSK